MKVVHFGEFVPHGAGMYHTIHDLILAERSVGIDAQFIDWSLRKEGNQPYSRVGLIDGDIETVGFEFAEAADVLVRHSAVPERFDNNKKPLIFMLHGRPEYSFELEYRKKTNVFNEILLMSEQYKYKAFATFWPEHMSPWITLLDKYKGDFSYIPPVVDLDYFNPDGKRFSFGKDLGTPNIVITDMWREDVSPYQTIMAVAHWIRHTCPKARLHVFGISDGKNMAINNLIAPLQRRGVIGCAKPILKCISEVYRSADILITPHNIATRVVREALASGCPVLAGIGSKYTPYTASAYNHDGVAKQLTRLWGDIQKDYLGSRRKARAMAEKEFNFKNTGEAALELFNKVLDRKPGTKPNVQVKHKSRIYVSTPTLVRNTKNKKYDNLDIGQVYNDYMEMLPHDDDYGCFIDHDAMWTTNDWFTQISDIVAKNPDYGMFTVVTTVLAILSSWL